MAILKYDPYLNEMRSTYTEEMARSELEQNVNDWMFRGWVNTVSAPPVTADVKISFDIGTQKADGFDCLFVR